LGIKASVPAINVNTTSAPPTIAPTKKLLEKNPLEKKPFEKKPFEKKPFEKKPKVTPRPNQWVNYIIVTTDLKYSYGRKSS
jgi:hypothetical protein